MIPSHSIFPDSKHNEPLLISPLNSPSTPNVSPRVFTTTLQADSTSLSPLDFFNSNTFYSMNQATSNHSALTSAKQDEIKQDLIDWTIEEKISMLDIFDPLKQTKQSTLLPCESDEIISKTSSVATSNIDTLVAPVASAISIAQPYPIKLKLKLATCLELKPFSRIVQQLLSQPQAQQAPSDGTFYCKHVERLTSQHIKQSQSPVTLYILTNSLKEPICLTEISLQSTVAQILRKLLEIFQFDYDQSILKLRSCDEYLRHDDVLCNIEYVYNCIYSIKQIQFVLVKKPSSPLRKKQAHISFEEFCLNDREKYFQTKQTRLLQSTKTSNKSKQLISLDVTCSSPLSNPHWREDFRENIDRKLRQIEQCFNRLVNPDSSKLLIDEQIELIEELISCSKTIQSICLDIKSTSLFERQLMLKFYAAQLKNQSENQNEQVSTSKIPQNLTRLLYDLLLSIMKYVQTYCQAFLIPYEVEIYDDENKSIDIQTLKTLSTTTTTTDPRPIIESLELCNILIGSLSYVPSNIKTVRIVVRLCYGNQTKAKQMTSLMPFVRNIYPESSLQVDFNEQLIFNDIHLCELQREALLLFEIYASFVDEADPSVASLVSEVFDGVSMCLVGWCSQALFDHEHTLISGEHYLGIIDAATTARTGFYSLRNILDRNCPILTISLPNQSFYLPKIQARKDMFVKKELSDISLDNRKYLNQLINRQNLLLTDHSVMITNETSMNNRKQQLSPNMLDNDSELSDEYHFLWSHRHYLLDKPCSLAKLLKSRLLWDYPSLIDIYGFINETDQRRNLDEIELFELLLPAFPDMHIRSFAYQSLISRLKPDELIFYLPQILQIIKFDYNYSSTMLKYLLERSMNDYRIAHKLYWHLRQLLLTETIHFIRYYYLYMALVYIIEDYFRTELETQSDLCINLRKIRSELKSSELNREDYLSEQLKNLNNEFFQSNQRSCRLPCQFSFITNSIDIKSCSIFRSLTCPLQLVFDPIDLSSETFYAIYKTGDDLRQDQIVLQLLTCMDKIWQSNDIDCRLSLFNVTPTEERCGFIEMITDSETLLKIEKPLGAWKGSFGVSALYNWLRLHNTNEKDFLMAVDNLTYSCAGYCVATYLLGIGDRHNENIMVKKSGHLFHIDFGKCLGDKQKFGWFNRDRAPFIFTTQMLYAMSNGGTSNFAMHRFVDLCCDAFCILRQNSSLILMLLSHLCSSNVPRLNYDAVRFVYDRLTPSLNYAESTKHFTDLIVGSLDSTWTKWNGLIHKLANGSGSLMPSDTLLSFVPQTFTIATDGKILFAQVIDYEKEISRSKPCLYKIRVVRENTMYHYRTYKEFFEFYEGLIKQFPMADLDLKSSNETEDSVIIQKRVKHINDFLGALFRLASNITESDLVCTFFHTIQRDQQINDAREKVNDELSTLSLNIPPTNNQSTVRLQLLYDTGKLFVMVRYANNLPLKNGNQPTPYSKCYLLPDESKLTKQKGKPSNSRNPIFNDTFTYEMDLSEIQKRILRVGVWNHILNVGNHVLGTVDILLSEIDWSKKHVSDYTISTSDT
ncbi:unnamed protein product [Rotaria socialis]|uniref:Phosphatidylinositol-4-phosphate 3-kinase n=1 Tax=Rotaria socialis TaxID=392032 RepID=A0A819AUZ1_9BILA|nr:unnamed protein product [Rotaria socialis]CAF4681567.1 unnamed protein product [Rotaria socialis]